MSSSSTSALSTARITINLSAVRPNSVPGAFVLPPLCAAAFAVAPPCIVVALPSLVCDVTGCDVTSDDVIVFDTAADDVTGADVAAAVVDSDAEVTDVESGRVDVVCMGSLVLVLGPVLCIPVLCAPVL